MSGEEALVRAIRDLVGGAGADAGVRVGIGDDCAVLEPRPGAALLATTDLLIEDVHFRRRWAQPADIGWKAMAVNLSDIAAMGGRPRWALFALACPEGTDTTEVEAFYEGALGLARTHEVAIVGGDTSASPAGWIVNVTLLGEALPLRLRSTARIGDIVAVTGTLGGSGAGLALLERGAAPASLAGKHRDEVVRAHLRPRPRVPEGRWLVSAGGVTALMDLSDGLGIDLPRLLTASGAGAAINVDRVPIHESARATGAALGVDPVAWATGGGEDYELLLTCEPQSLGRLQQGLRDVCGTPLTPIGEVIEGAGDVNWSAGGRPVTVARGFEHFVTPPVPSGVRA
jgi:thiamine-monophosphate kinase